MLDARVVQRDALPQPLDLGLHEDIPLDVAERARRLAIVVIAPQQALALVECRAVVADNVLERGRVPAHAAGDAAAVDDRLACLVDDAGQGREALGQATDVGAKGGVLDA